MQVILIKPVRKLGKVGEIVNVKNGYGRNFLLPVGMAIRATKENLSKFAVVKNEIEEKNNREKEAMAAAASLLADKHIIFVTQSGADGRLFGSISLKMLAATISDMAQYKLTYSNILLENPIKFNGVHNVRVMFHPEIFASVLIVVAKTDSEAQNALAEYKEGKNSKSESEKEVQLEVSEDSAQPQPI